MSEKKKDSQPNDDAKSDGNEGGIGCSNMAYYNALMKGRVTRNRIRKEEDTPVAEPKKTKDKLLSTKKLLLKKPLIPTQRLTPVEPEVKKREEKTSTKEVYAMKLAQAKEQAKQQVIQESKKSQNLKSPSPVVVVEKDQSPAKQPPSAKKPTKKDPVEQAELAQIQRHLEMIEKFEQHFPHFQFIKNRLILYSESYAEIESVDLSKTSGLENYEKLQAQVKIYADSPSIPMHIKFFKYLSKVFICSLSHVDQSKLSDELQENIASSELPILVVQIIDNANKYPSSLKFSSHQPLQFYALGKDEFEDRLILSGPISFKGDPLKDLQAFDETAKLCYRKEDELFIKKEAAQVQGKYDKSQRIPVTEKNLKECMFTVCLYDSQEGLKGKGVLLATRVENNEVMLLFRQIQMRQMQKDKLEWIKLEWQSGVSHVESEFHRGFVSLEYLKSLDNSFGTGLKLRTKHITFVSHEASLLQQHKYLSQGQGQDVEMLSEYSVATVMEKPCAKCSKKDSSQMITCSDCSKVWHHSCVDTTRPGISEKLWRCPSCVRCSYCRSMVGQLLICRCCNSPYHVECLDPSFKQVIDSKILDSQEKPLRDVEFKCHQCVKCSSCGGSSGPWSSDFKTCVPCSASIPVDCATCSLKVDTKFDILWQKQNLKDKSYNCLKCRKRFRVKQFQKFVLGLDSEINQEFNVDLQLSRKIKSSTYVINEDSDLLEDILKIVQDKKIIAFVQSKYAKRPEYLQKVGLIQKNENMYSNLIKKPTPELKTWEKNVLPKIVCEYIKQEHQKFSEEIPKPIPKPKKVIPEPEVIVEPPRKKINQSAAPEFVIPQRNLIELTPEVMKEPKLTTHMSHNFTAPPERRLGRPAKSVYSNPESGATSVVASNIIFKDKNRKKMMEHYQREDDEGCYYSNPIRCSFDDPKLIFEEMCYMCGSFGHQEDFVTCLLCSESFHTYCLQLTTDQIQEMYQSNWKCLNCKSCEFCGKATDEDKLNFCGRCDRPYHSFCLQPEITHVPEQWKCEHCFNCKSCGTNAYYNDEDVSNEVNLTNSDYSLSQNFTLCYSCGQNEYKKQSCNICMEKTTNGMHVKQQTLKCQGCGYYSHVECSRVDITTLKSLLNEVNSKKQGEPIKSIEKIYKCLDCIISGKTINFLILESCLHYEYIHNLIQRQKLLGDICVEILAKYFPEQYRAKAPIFIERFISQNQDFFKHDCTILKWLDLMQNEIYLESDADEPTPVRVEELKGKWNKFNPFDFNSKEETRCDTEAARVETQMMGYKESLLPEKRSVYNSLYKGDLNRNGKKDLFIKPDEIQEKLYDTEEAKKQLVNRLVTGIDQDEELSFESSDSSDENPEANKKTLVETYVQTELKAVMKIKQQFFKWFEEFFTKTMNVFLGQNQEKTAQNENSASSEMILSEQNEYRTDDSSSQVSLVSCREDFPIENPQANLVCLLCKQKGEFSVTGRLIPYKYNMYVHISCALWTTEVFEVEEEKLINFYQQQKKLFHQKCCFCNEIGATMSCARTKGCNKHFHFPCAYRSGKVKFTKNKEAYCENCNKIRGNTSNQNSGYKSDNDQDIMKFPYEFMKKKRLYIVNNFEEISQQEYENDFENESDKKGKDKKTPNKKKDQKSQDSPRNSQPHREIEVDKWRPFYYDLFNRVGNLTVLSLSKEVNQLVDIIHKDNQSNSINSIQDYLKQQAERGNGRFQPLTGNLMEDLKRQLDLFSDYATIRIYWKFYDDNGMSRPARGNDDPRKLKRAYYLFIGSSKQIIEIQKNDLNTILEFCSQQIKENQITQNYFREAVELSRCDSEDRIYLNQDIFWKRLMDHFKGQKSNFCLQNIEFCVEKLFGLAKYPINVWNRLELTSNDLRHNLNSQKSKLAFFLKSALSIMSASGYIYPQLAAGSSVGSENRITAQKADKDSEKNNLSNLLLGKQMTIDGIFKRLVKVNNMERYDSDRITLAAGYSKKAEDQANGLLPYRRNDQRYNQMDQLSVNNLSSKHMTYTDMMIALGKGTKVDTAEFLEDLRNGKKRTERKKSNTLSVFRSQLQQAQQQRENQAQQLANNMATTTALPLAAQYRKAVQNPKKLEIGQSKIHRIGLFTQEKLKEGDILIEYVGEIIRHKVADQREKRYKEKGIGDCYLFKVDDQHVIDATFFGGKARYLNHSCQANCDAQTPVINGQNHILIFAKKNIMDGEELTYNYQFGQDEDNQKLACFCGAENCKGQY